MNKKLVWLLALLILAIDTFADAQQPKKVPRIGYLGTNPRSTNPARIDAFRQLTLRFLDLFLANWRLPGPPL